MYFRVLACNGLLVCTKIISGLCLVFCLSTVASADEAPATPTIREMNEECEEFSMSGMHECLKEKRDESQKKLLQAESYVNAVFSRWDVEDQYIAQARVRFITDKREFIKYREAHCLFIKSLGASGIGNALEMREYACITELNYRRIAQLREAVSQFQLK